MCFMMCAVSWCGLQDVSLQLQADELMIEDDAVQQELQEEQQREAGEAVCEAMCCCQHTDSSCCWQCADTACNAAEA